MPRWQPPRASPDSVHERSPYPAIDAFIADVVRSLPQPGGFVRGVVYFPEGTLLRHVSGRPSGCIQLSGSPPCARGRTCAGKHLLYHVGGCRYCELVERPHKSNHVNYVADLALGIYFQRCMDPDCRRQADRGPVHALPPELNPFRDDVPTPPGGRDGLADDDDWMWAVDVGPEQAGSNGRVARYGVGGGWRRFAARVLNAGRCTVASPQQRHGWCASGRCGAEHRHHEQRPPQRRRRRVVGQRRSGHLNM